MTPQEEQLLNSLVGRVNQTQLQLKDPDAEALLNRSLGSNPDALYILAQTILVQNIALSTLENFTLPGDVSASARYWKEDIIEPEVTVSAEGEIAIPDTPGRGYEVRYDLIERLTVRKETVRAFEMVPGHAEPLGTAVR